MPSKRFRTYSYTVLAVFLILGNQSGASFASLGFLLAGFVWNSCLLSSELKEQAMAYRQRWSFLRLLFRWDELLHRMLGEAVGHGHEAVMRSLSPLSFGLILALLLGQWKGFVLMFLGCLLFEASQSLYWRGNRKKLPK